MPFPNPDTQFKPGQSGNPTGPKPGYKHLSTYIRDAMEDEQFDLEDPQDSSAGLYDVVKGQFQLLESGEKMQYILPEEDSKKQLDMFGES